MKVLSAALVINASHTLLEMAVSPCYHQWQCCADGTLTWSHRWPCGDSRGLLRRVFQVTHGRQNSPLHHSFSATSLLRDCGALQLRGDMPVGEASRPPCLPLGDQFPMDAGPPVWPSTMSGEMAVSMLNCCFRRRRSCSWRKIYLALGLKKQLKILLYSGFAKSHKSR